ncbi:MAG: archaea-specific SMC-related protein [Salinirussus sp.]
MERAETDQRQVRVHAENVGGIERTTVGFDDGVTVLTGRNASNRTSLLQAIMAGLGSDRASLKGDAESGRVRLQVGDEEHTRELERGEDEVVFGGDPYLDDPELADLFAFLLESNEARRTVALGGDLREIIMDPVDAASIRAEIRQLESEKRDLEETIEERKSLRDRLPDLEAERADVEARIEDKRAELEAAREELEERSGDGDDARTAEADLEDAMGTLQSRQSDLETVEFRLDSQRDSLDSLETELAELEDRREGLAGTEADELDRVTSEISRLQERKQRLDAELSRLQNVIQFNEEMLDGTSQDIAAALRGDDDRDVTDQLLDGPESVVCWTCGTEVETARIEETLDRLRELRESKYRTQSETQTELSELRDERSELESSRQERRNLERRIEDVREEIERREANVDELEKQRAELEAEIEELEAEIEELEARDRSEVIDAHKLVNQRELELERLEEERADVEARIEETEARLDEVERLKSRRESIDDQLAELRTRIDRIEQQAVEEFNSHMDTVLEMLDYANIDRIWVERAEQEVRRGRQTVTEPEFRLHVIRSTEDDVTYEDEFEHLSESEREVTGLVFALAGYLAHEVYEEVPFMLLDSLEAIDSGRIATLVDYLGEYADYLVVALLPEDAAALDDDYERISEI